MKSMSNMRMGDLLESRRRVDSGDKYVVGRVVEANVVCVKTSTLRVAFVKGSCRRQEKIDAKSHLKKHGAWRACNHIARAARGIVCFIAWLRLLLTVMLASLPTRSGMFSLSQPLSLLLFISHIMASEKGIYKGTFYCGKGNENTVIHAEKGDSGHIASLGYPEAYHPKSFQNSWCEVRIRACRTCKIQLKLLELDFPPCNETAIPVPMATRNINCIPGCDHLYLHEVDHPYNLLTESYYYDEDNGNSYISTSAHVRLLHCLSNITSGTEKKFHVSFDILDKNELRQGIVAEYGSTVGRITSPNFPNGYAMNGETFTYMIQNLDPYGHVRLNFDDWDISPGSEVKLYDGLSTNSPSISLDRHHRPVIVSDSNTLVIVFDTGVNPEGCCSHMGFKAAYEFVSEKAWPTKPSTDCSRIYHMKSGGMIDFTGSVSHQGQPKFYDCVWIIRRIRGEESPDGVVLRMREVLLGDGWLQYGKINSLEIRDGTSSLSPMKHKYTAKNLTHAQTFYTSGDGLYIRLKGGFYTTDKLSFIFTAVKNISDTGGCPGYFEYLCQNLLCIDQDLMCDGMDHCGDGSDESPALDCSVSEITTPSSSPCNHGFMCQNGIECLAASKHCDGLVDCQDASDEYGCYKPGPGLSAATIQQSTSFILLICILIVSFGVVKR